MTALQKEIKQITNLIRNQYKPEKIILFGSAARGEMKEDSDLDFFIVKNSNKPRHQRSELLYKIIRNLNYEYPIDFIVYTPTELQKQIKMGDFFIENILNQGKEIYVK